MKPLRLCCTSENNCHAADTPGEPCWGRVAAIDEDCVDDPELRTWVHGCEGHEDRFGKYKPEPAGDPPAPEQVTTCDPDRHAKALFAAAQKMSLILRPWLDLDEGLRDHFRQMAAAVLAVKDSEQ